MKIYEDITYPDESPMWIQYPQNHLQYPNFHSDESMKKTSHKNLRPSGHGDKHGGAEQGSTAMVTTGDPGDPP